MAQLGRYRGNVGPIGDRYGRRRVAELVRVEAGKAVFRAEFIKVSCRGLWVQRLPVVLGKAITLKRGHFLLAPQLPQQ